MTETDKKDTPQLKIEWEKTVKLRMEWKETVELRNIVLDWAKRTGFSANQLVSRTAEHELELTYGKKVLESSDKKS